VINTWWELGTLAFVAGVIDAVMGGGGMIQVPALFSAFPTLSPAVIFGTNKLASAAGTVGAAVQYARARPPAWKTVVPVALAAFLASALGAWLLTRVPAEPLRLALPFVLLALLAYTLLSPSGLDHAPRFPPGREAGVAAAGAAAVGLYDGFFGPGAGAFYKAYFVRVLGFDFLNSAAPAKIANLASNAGAILVFLVTGMVLWPVALGMALANFLGGQLGSRIALRYGNRFLRRAFLALVIVLIARSFRDAYLR